MNIQKTSLASYFTAQTDAPYAEKFSADRFFISGTDTPTISARMSVEDQLYTYRRIVIYLNSYEKIENKTYDLSASNPEVRVHYVISNDTTTLSPYVAERGLLKISFDPDKNVAEGTLDCTAKAPTGQQVVVSKGTFGIQDTGSNHEYLNAGTHNATGSASAHVEIPDYGKNFEYRSTNASLNLEQNHPELGKSWVVHTEDVGSRPDPHHHVLTVRASTSVVLNKTYNVAADTDKVQALFVILDGRIDPFRPKSGQITLTSLPDPETAEGKIEATLSFTGISDGGITAEISNGILSVEK